MKVTLQVYGREMTFSEQELIAIVDKQTRNETTIFEVAQKPTEGKCFEVKPQNIDQKLFENPRKDKKQEETRQLILEAFDQMKKNPKKYGRNFKTMILQKLWVCRNVAQLLVMADEIGDHNADWVEQALEWAQRIANGESWESICNDEDATSWYRLVEWKKGYARLVGGSIIDYCTIPRRSASNVDCCDYYNKCNLSYAVPLVVVYE